VRALAATSRAVGADPRLLDVVDHIKNRQNKANTDNIEQHIAGQLAGRTIAVWGLAFKPRTDDIREAPSLVLIERLLAAGAKLHVHDPEALANVRNLFGDKLLYAEQPYDALPGAEALAIITEWKEFLQPDFARMRSLMKAPVVFDGRNLYSTKAMRAAGFTYYSIGRATVKP
jgi:UDPglucose 6-dehydrogenase